MTRPNHNTPNGPLKACQVCGGTDLELVIDLGHQPLADTLVSQAGLNEPETYYPLRQVWCKGCTLNQLDYVVPGEIVYHHDYPYKTGVTKELVEYQAAMATEIKAVLGLKEGDLATDLGSNDGTLLKGFKAVGLEVQGIEPTDVAKLAEADGIPTFQMPFNPEAAKKVVAARGQAKIATSTNVFAHMATLGDFMQGLEILVANDGYFVLENHYLTAITEKLQFDTIYHEHLRSYSLHALVKLFSYYDFTIVDVRKTDRYGGNIRCYVARGKNHTPKASVQALLDEERKVGMHTSAYYADFRKKCEGLKDNFVRLVMDLKAQGKTVVGNSCPARASTLLNYAGMGRDVMPYIAEQPHSLKLHKHLPGKHIPIVNNQRLIDEQPDYVVLLAWHLAEPIMQQLRARGLKSKFIMPMPVVEVID
jgi:hypothetical protein